MNLRLSAILSLAMMSPLAACDQGDETETTTESDASEVQSGATVGGAGPLGRVQGDFEGKPLVEHLAGTLYRMHDDGSWTCMQGERSDGARAFLYLYPKGVFKLISEDAEELNRLGRWQWDPEDGGSIIVDGRSYKVEAWENGIALSVPKADGSVVKLMFSVDLETTSEHEPEDPDALLLEPEEGSKRDFLAEQNDDEEDVSAADDAQNELQDAIEEASEAAEQADGDKAADRGGI